MPFVRFLTCPEIMKSIVRHALLALTCGLQVLLLPAQPARAGNTGPADPMPSTVHYDRCSWNRPGADPFMGELPAAVDRYRDIPPEVRARLKARMEARQYDDLVSIRRDSIEGRAGYDYGKTISDMHFGANKLCHSVSRDAWSPDMQERGLVYCESGQCIIVPTVCRNVSRITRSGVGPEAAAAPPLLAATPAIDGFPAIDWFGPASGGLPASADAPVDGPVAGDAPLEGTVGGYAADGFGVGPLLGAAFVGGVAAAGPWTGGGAGTSVASISPGPGAGAPLASAAVAAHQGRVGVWNGAGNAEIVAAVPEPAPWFLLLGGLGAIAWCRQVRSRGRK